MKTTEERLQYAAVITNKVDDACVFDGSFSEGSEDYYKKVITQVTGSCPQLWEDARASFEFAYSNMFCKLLLAYLISEIKEGNILKKDFLNQIREMELTSYYDFDYCDTGTKTSYVLEKIVEEVVAESQYFKMDYEIIDTYGLIKEEPGYGIMEKKFYNSLIEAFPLLKTVFKPKDVEEELFNICNYPDIDEDFETELEIIESAVMYQIEKKEENNPTKEGQQIIEESKRIFTFIMQNDYLYNDLAWKIVDDKSGKVYYCSVTCSSVYGDEYYYPLMTLPRINRYRYSCVFEILELCKKIKKYINKNYI